MHPIVLFFAPIAMALGYIFVSWIGYRIWRAKHRREVAERARRYEESMKHAVTFYSEDGHPTPVPSFKNGAKDASRTPVSVRGGRM